jgi:thioredoxin 1
MAPCLRAGRAHVTLRPMDGKATDLLVICLCAQWCGVCRDYVAVFEELRAQFDSQCELSWIDIEDEAELLDGVDVEDFPTLLIAQGSQPLFFGPITPHAQTLERLVQGALAGDLRPLTGADDHLLEIGALAGRISARS